MNHYEAVFILNPVLSDDQVKETVKKFEDYLSKKGSEIISTEHWGLKKFAYPIQNKQSGFYNLIDFKAPPTIIDSFEVELRRDERIISKSELLKIGAMYEEQEIKDRNNLD